MTGMNISIVITKNSTEIFKKNQKLSDDSVNSLLDIYPKEITLFVVDNYTSVFAITLFTITRKWK